MRIVVILLLVSCLLSASIGHEEPVQTREYSMTHRGEQCRFCALLTSEADSDDDSPSCQCCQCCQTPQGVLGQEVDTSNGHLLSDRWTSTATDGFAINRGDSITLTWGFVEDGTDVGGGTGFEEGSLIATLDNNFSETNTSADLTQRTWFQVFAGTFERYAALSGLNFVYETNDDGRALDGSGRGALGVVADVRIGGRSIDGQTGRNVLAFNSFPNSGDMVIDTDNTNVFNANDIEFRNVIAHEFGHGLGIPHLLSNSDQFLLEPVVQRTFDGPQHADVLALHRGYGDHFESGDGNDTVANATDLGDVANFQGVGLDGSLQEVEMTDEDFVSIDGDSDTDVFSFDVAEAGDFTITLAPMGYEYDIAAQNFSGNADESTRVTVNTRELNDLGFELLDQDGSSVLGIADDNGLGVSDSLDISLTSGTFFIVVTGSVDRVQLYSITADVTPLVGYDFENGNAVPASGFLAATAADFTVGSFANGVATFNGNPTLGFSSFSGTLFARTTATAPGTGSADAGDTLAGAIANDAYFSVAVTNDSGSAIDLGTLDFDYVFTAANGPSSYQMYLMSDVGGFVAGSEIGLSEHAVGTSGDLTNIESFDVSALGPLANADSIEFRFYLVDANSAVSQIHRLDNVALTRGTPGPVLLGDVNCDGSVDFLDISPFIALLSSGEFSDKADIDGSGVVDFLDISPFIVLLSSP